jgi:hypothetical protein
MLINQIKQKLPFKSWLLPAIVAVLVFAASSVNVLAANEPCHPENDHPPGTALTPDQLKSCEACNKNANLQQCLKNNVLVKDIQLLVDVLSAGVGVVVVGSLIFAGIQYSFAGDNPQETSAAKNRIINSLLALVAFFLTFAFLEWLIPGGIFG